MIRKYLLPALALAGVILGIYVAINGAKTIAPAMPVSDSPQSPYPNFVAGSAIVEASTENICIGTAVPGIVTKIFVQIGSNVKAKDPLFLIDDRALLAQLAVNDASIKVAEAQLKTAKDDLAFNETANKNLVSQQDLAKFRNAVSVAEAQISMARAQMGQTATDIERLTVRAPVDGQVLQLKVHLGEWATSGVLTTPLILLGNVEKLNVRVNVDENDAWRVKNGVASSGFLRGNKNITTPLKFVRFEPYVIPKTSLTGDSTERVDTRVLQVIYEFQRGELPIYVGQQMDVFIDAPEPKPAPPAATEKRL